MLQTPGIITLCTLKVPDFMEAIIMRLITRYANIAQITILILAISSFYIWGVINHHDKTTPYLLPHVGMV